MDNEWFDQEVGMVSDGELIETMKYKSKFKIFSYFIDKGSWVEWKNTTSKTDKCLQNQEIEYLFGCLLQQVKLWKNSLVFKCVLAKEQN